MQDNGTRIRRRVVEQCFIPMGINMMDFGLEISSLDLGFMSFLIMIFIQEVGEKAEEMAMEFFLRQIKKYSKVIGLMIKSKALEVIYFFNKKKYLLENGIKIV